MCGRCGFRLPDDVDAENCGNCGADVIDAARSAGLCGGCGNQLPPRTKNADGVEEEAFCGTCGTPVGDEWLKLRLAAGKCHKCNHPMPDDPTVTFCGVCGTKRMKPDAAATLIQKVFRGAKARKALGLALGAARRAKAEKAAASGTPSLANAVSLARGKSVVAPTTAPPQVERKATAAPPSAADAAPKRVCLNCSAPSSDPAAKFCGQCGNNYDANPKAVPGLSWLA